MIIYFSNMKSWPKALSYLDPPADILISYVEFRKRERSSEEKVSLERYKTNRVFLDSGAFSVFTGKAQFTWREYFRFVEKNQDLFEVGACLDVIGDGDASFRNWKRSQRCGLELLPTYHYGEDRKFLRKYLDNGVDYIALGGVAKVNAAIRRRWFFDVWEDMHKINPGIKVHGFGITDISILREFDWYSVDSSSVRATTMSGGVLSPWGNVMLSKYTSAMRRSSLFFERGSVARKVFSEWLDSLGLGFCFEELCPNIFEATLKRAAVSMEYLRKLFVGKEENETGKRGSGQ